MGIEDHAKSDPAETLGTTLGDVLFSKTTAPVPESEWVNLLHSIAARDKQALHSLYCRTHMIVFTLVMRIAQNRQTAEEVTLDVFHDVWRRAPLYDAANGSVIGWVMNQARSRAIDRLRFDQRKKRVDPGPDATDANGIAARPDDALELERQAHRLRAALAVLTEHEREAIEMTFFAGLTHAESAARLDQPLGTLKTRIRTGLSKLRDALGEGLEP
ncbi:MAG TPA: sigma-70 family RNA polymerase sigma factor [Polyangiaceae bacterium]